MLAKDLRQSSNNNDSFQSQKLPESSDMKRGRCECEALFVLPSEMDDGCDAGVTVTLRRVLSLVSRGS
jgi:hypothetical protein